MVPTLAFTPTFCAKIEAEARILVVTIAVLIIFFIAISLSDVPFGVLHQRNCIIAGKKAEMYGFQQKFTSTLQLKNTLERNYGDGKLSHTVLKRFG